MGLTIDNRKDTAVQFVLGNQQSIEFEARARQPPQTQTPSGLLASCGMEASSAARCWGTCARVFSGQGEVQVVGVAERLRRG